MSTVFQNDLERQLTYRCRRLNSAPIGRGDGQYVLCWLQQTLRGELNPVIDAAIALGNLLNLPVVVYHGLGQHYPHASDRLHQFILEASYSLERDVNARGLRFLRMVERNSRPAKDLVYRLASCAAAIVIDDLSAFVGRWQAALQQLHWAGGKVIPYYASSRNNPARYGVTWLSPYLHFGVLGPQDVVAVALQVDAPRDRWKFLDELLVWREFFHHTAQRFDDPSAYGNLPEWARQTLADHASDPRPAIYDLHALVQGQTDDETWNAAQRQFLIDGWMHNNLRMYWEKRLIEWTATPEIVWKTACYLNDRFSLDGRDPATYGNLRWCFGSGRPAVEVPVYGTVSRKSDRAMRSRPGVTDWLFHAALRTGPVVSIPETIPVWSRPQASGAVAACPLKPEK